VWRRRHVQSDFSATQQEIIVKFWTLNKEKVPCAHATHTQHTTLMANTRHDTRHDTTRQLHAKVRKNAMWGTELHKFAWRIDVKSKARAVSEMNEPVAIVELTLGKKVPYLLPMRPYRVHSRKVCADVSGGALWSCVVCRH
jgi:hypothetical protein